MSPGDTIWYFWPSAGVTVRLRPCTVTVLIFPDFASSMNCEYETPSWTRGLSNCLNTVNSTSAITSHTAALENILLFKAPLLTHRRVPTYTLRHHKSILIQSASPCHKHSLPRK